MTTPKTRSADQQAILDRAERDGVRGYFRFGSLPDYAPYEGARCSTNHRDGGYEEGVSVYQGWMVGDALVLDLRGIDALSGLYIMDAGRQAYRCEGVVLSARGADGEPLMLDQSVLDGDDEWAWMVESADCARITMTAIDPDHIEVVLS